MNPLKWIRWKAVAALAVLGAAIYVAGLQGALLASLNAAGRTSRAARFSAGGLGLGLLSGELRLDELLVGPAPRAPAGAAPGGAIVAERPREESHRALTAERVTVDVSAWDLLSRRFVVERAALHRPVVEVMRRPDGTANVGDLGEGPGQDEAPPETLPESAKNPLDWLGTVQRWYERIQRARKWVPARPGRKDKGRAPWSADYSRGADYPFEGRPGFEVREVAGEDLRIAFVDEARGETIATLEEGVLRIRNLSSRPSAQKDPTSFELTGKLAGSPVSVRGLVDFRGDRSRMELDADLPGLPASLVGAFAGASLPVRLASGKIGVRAKIALDGLDAIDVRPAMAFDGVTLEAKDPGGKIAGFEAERFVRAFNEASKELGAFAIEDLRITGSFFAPKFEWGNTVKDLVVSGAKAFAKKRLDAGIEKGSEKLGELLEKAEIPAPAASEIRRTVGEAVEGLKSGGVEKLLPGVFGGKRGEGAEEGRRKGE